MRHEQTNDSLTQELESSLIEFLIAFAVALSSLTILLRFD